MNHHTRIVLAISLCTVSLLVVPYGGATFNDAETVDGGTVEGGVLDLKLSEVGPATRGSTTDEQGRDAVERTWVDTSHGILTMPTTLRNTLVIDNTHSSLAAERVGISVSYNESDGPLTLGGNADATARTLVLERFSYDGTGLLDSHVGDENGNGYLDVEDLTLGSTARNLTSLPGISAGDSAPLRIEIAGDRGLLGLVEGSDGIDLTFTVAGRTAQFEDSDVSTSNTIRYG